MENILEINQKGKAPASIKMEISPDVEKMFKGDPFFLEIEMLQGQKAPLPSGLIRYSITVKEQQKIDILWEFALKMFSQSHQPDKLN